MVAQLVVILGLAVLLGMVGGLYLLHRALGDMKELANNALMAGRATSARDLAEAKEYSEDARFGRELAKTGTEPAVATLAPQPDTYTTPEGVELKVLRPFL